MTEDDLAKLRAGRLPIGSDETGLTIYAMVDHIDSLAVQIKTANGFRDAWHRVAIKAVGDLEAAEARASLAEAKLAAVREALDVLDESGDVPRDRLDSAFDALGVDRLGSSKAGEQ